MTKAVFDDLQEETDRLEYIDHGVVEAAIEVIDENDDRLHGIEAPDQGLEFVAEVRDGLEHRRRPWADFVRIVTASSLAIASTPATTAEPMAAPSSGDIPMCAAARFRPLGRGRGQRRLVRP